MATPGILIVQDDFVEAERLRLLLAAAGHVVVGSPAAPRAPCSSRATTGRIWRSST